MEIGKSVFPLRHLMQRQGHKRGHAIGHIVRGLVLPANTGDNRGFASCRKKINRDVPHGTASGTLGVRRIVPGQSHPVIKRGERRTKLLTDRGAQPGASAKDCVGIDVAADFARNVAFARWDQSERKAATLSISRRIEIVCSACQRLNGSASWAARKARSLAARSVMSLIGAEKPRLIEMTGSSSILTNSNLAT